MRKGLSVYYLTMCSNWYGNNKVDVAWDENNEPTAADHGDVLYTIGKSETIGRYMVAKRDVEPEEVVFTDEPAVIGNCQHSLL